MKSTDDNQLLKAQFDRDGFVIVREFLSGVELTELLAELARYLQDVVPTLPDKDAFFDDRQRPETLKQLQHMGGDPFFRDYQSNSHWQRLAGELLGEPCKAQEPEWFNKPPGSAHVTPPHQDNFYFCLRPPNVVTLWLALDHVNQENGGLRYSPGSHRKGIRDHNPTQVLGFSQGIVDYGPDDVNQEVAIELRPGDLVAHHGETIHRAEANHSRTRHRRAFAMVYHGESCQRDDFAYARYQAALKSQHKGLGLATVAQSQTDAD